MSTAMAQSHWAAARSPGVFGGCSSRHSVRCLERAGQTAARYPSRRSVPLWNSNALVASLTLPVSRSICLTPPKQLLPEVHGVLRHGLLGNSAFTCNMPLQNKCSSDLNIAPVMRSVLQFEVLSQPGVLIQISFEMSLILLFLRKIITIFRVPLHFLRL